MNELLITTLKELVTDKAVVVKLYERLFNGEFFTVVNPDTGLKIEMLEFLSYPTVDNATEIPIYTREEYIFGFDNYDISIINIPANILWPRLLDVIDSSQCQIAVDPGQAHGIRVTKTMILGMISTYAQLDN